MQLKGAHSSYKEANIDHQKTPSFANFKKKSANVKKGSVLGKLATQTLLVEFQNNGGVMAGIADSFDVDLAQCQCAEVNIFAIQLNNPDHRYIIDIFIYIYICMYIYMLYIL